MRTDDKIQPVGKKSDTATQILDVAERLVQVSGFNAISYADVAAELNITKAALHYHFPGKAELGEALIARYAARFADALVTVETRTSDAPGRLSGYVQLYADVLRKKRMCLCGMLAAEYQTLPGPMREAVVQFFDANEAWLTRVLKQGRVDATLQYVGAPREAARTLVSGLEGAMLIARPYGDMTRFQSVASHLLAALTPAALEARR